ncbi:30S ribosomal protein S3 [Candidatus Margulisiibacteriota bacterium]
MGQKANPIIMRMGINREAESVWFDYKNYSKLLYEDFIIRNKIKEDLKNAGIAKLKILRKRGLVEINVYAAKPGVIIGKSGSDVTFLREELNKLTGKKISINIIEEKDTDKSAKLLAENIAFQLEKRVPFRRAMKMYVQRALKAGVEGIKVACAGRLGGVEIARSEWYREGKVPLHTLRANIDYAFTEALTTYGKIGVKVWVYKGEILKNLQG